MSWSPRMARSTWRALRQRRAPRRRYGPRCVGLVTLIGDYLRRRAGRLPIPVSNASPDAAVAASASHRPRTSGSRDPSTRVRVRAVTANPRAVTIDVSNVRTVDARFLGLLLILWKLLRVQDVPLKMTGASRRLRTMFRLQGVGYLLSRQGA